MPRTLAEWSAEWPYLVRPWHGTVDAATVDAATPARVYVTPDTCDAAPGVRAAAFRLTDYVVSSVTGGSIWFVART